MGKCRSRCKTQDSSHHSHNPGRIHNPAVAKSAKTESATTVAAITAVTAAMATTMSPDIASCYAACERHFKQQEEYFFHAGSELATALLRAPDLLDPTGFDRVDAHSCNSAMISDSVVPFSFIGDVPDHHHGKMPFCRLSELVVMNLREMDETANIGRLDQRMKLQIQ